MNQDGKNENELYLRPVSASICDLFEDLLEEYDITIPSDDREGADGEARLYGDVYYDLEARVTEVLAELCAEVKAAPNVVINTEDYNGFEGKNISSEKIKVDDKANKKVLSYAEQAEMYIKENPGIAWEINTLIERENHREDIIGKLEQKGLTDIPDEDIENLIDEFERALSKNDGYYEAFWSSADYVIEEYIASKITDLEETSEASFERHILSKLTENGFDISQIELEIVNFVDNDHRDCSWYGGVVAEVKYKDYLFSLEARGDINCTLFDENENEVGYVKDRNNGGSFRYEMAHCLANDAELYKAKEDGLLVFDNNNWFEIFLRTPDNQWQTMTWLSESDDIEECVFEMIETVDEMIEDIGKDYEPKKSADKSLNYIVADAIQRSAETNTDKTLNTELTKE